jgi:hypothetical protein
VRLTRDPRWGLNQWDWIDACVTSVSSTYERLTPKTGPTLGHAWRSPVGPQAERELDLTIGAVHPSFWRVLAGCLFGRGVLALRARAPEGSPVRMDWPSLLDLPRFVTPEQTPFPVSILEYPGRFDRVTIQWVFQAPLDEATAATVFQIVADWGLIIDGGFPGPGSAPASSLSGAVPPYQADRFTIEHRVIPWSCDQEALRVLVSLAAHVDRSMAPLAELLIE